MAYDRLLERLYVIDDGWIVKGATALLARDLGVRGTIDVDLLREGEVGLAEAELREAAALDLGDWFAFEAGPSLHGTDVGRRLRVPIKASIGPTAWTSFHVDLVGAGVTMTGTPDHVPALARVAMPDVTQGGYRAYPLVDHIADKVAATFDRYGAARAVSTRYKDLVDLVAIATAASVEAVAQMAALESEARRRELGLPKSFDIPDRGLWEPGYAAEAKRSLLAVAQTLDEALATVRPLLDPVLDGGARGSWNPAAGRWQ